MKCYKIWPNDGCPTKTGCLWFSKRDEELFPSDNNQWGPEDDAFYEEGGRGWTANEPLTAASKAKLAKLWAHATGAKKPLSECHVIGSPQIGRYPDTIVDDAFVAAVERLTPGLLEFTEHRQVWDEEHKCPPREGRFFVSTILQRMPSYDLEASDIAPMKEGLTGPDAQYGSSGSRRAVRPSIISGRILWRDSYTRDVLCTQPFADMLESLGIEEWKLRTVNVIDDRH